jgi:uncharacterized damage-inducible protein DinB
MTERERLVLEPIADDPEVGRWLAALEDSRGRTLEELEGLDAEALDVRQPEADNSFGSLLYHIALIEADWLLVDIFGATSSTPEEEALLPFTDRDDRGELTHVEGETLDQHLDRLERVRAILLERLRPMPAEDFHTPRAREDYDVSPAWVLHHLLQHEAEHRSEIARLRSRLSLA